jgi:AraC-like DNA-binding protein
MSGFDQFELMIRGGSIALLLLWSIVLARDHFGALPARVAIAMNLCIIGYIVSGILFFRSTESFPGIFGDFLSIFSAAFFWLFALSWFNDRQHIGWKNWLPVLGLLLLYVAQSVIKLSGGVPTLIWLAMRFAMFGFALAGIWIAWHGRENDLIEQRRRFRLILVGVIGGFVILVNLTELLVRNESLDEQFRSLIEISIFIATFAISLLLYQTASSQMFAATILIEPAINIDRTLSPLAQRLVDHIDYNRSYRADGLTIAALAAQLGEQEYRLRRAINGELGFRNFTAFLNSYRLTEVRDALADPVQKEVPILTIALDAGFGSLGPFNRAFREAHDATPSEYRASCLKSSI